MLEKQIKYYLDNKKDLLKKYKGKFVVIKNNDVIGAYTTLSDAYDNTIKDHELGTFMIHQCLPVEPIRYITRVIY